ncbi:MAG: hypothetical protein WDN25_05825 [Acetobacteraceae bacterium]
METDNGLVWLDTASNATAHDDATQSPYEVADGTATMLAKSAFHVASIDMSIGYTVGYGTKEPLDLSLSLRRRRAVRRRAAGAARQRPLPAAFQMGLKRHAFWTDATIVVDRATQAFRIMRAGYRTDGGGRRNFSPEVGAVGAGAGQSVYYFPSSDFSVAGDGLARGGCRVNGAATARRRRWPPPR